MISPLYRFLLFQIILLSLLLVNGVALAGEKVTFAAFSREWEPFEMVVDSKPEGAAIDLFRALMPEGVELAVDLMPAPRSVLHVQGAPVYCRLESRNWWTRNANDYLWSEPVLTLKNVLYSSARKPVEFEGLASLHGLRIGCVRNYVYPDIQPLFESGDLERYDVNDDLLLLRMLKAGRVDVAIFDDISAIWMVSKDDGLNQDDFYVSQNPVGIANLRFVFNRDSDWKRRMPELNRNIRTKREDGTVDRILERYR